MAGKLLSASDIETLERQIDLLMDDKQLPEADIRTI
jgi:hypothetical protein